MRNMALAHLPESPAMLVLDTSMLIALAAFISSLSAFVWAVRRKP